MTAQQRNLINLGSMCPLAIIIYPFVDGYGIALGIMIALLILQVACLILSCKEHKKAMEEMDDRHKKEMDDRRNKHDERMKRMYGVSK